ncbi:MAG: hypothetical protein K0S34_1662 [Bacillales bacterium]|jgi:YjbE family integral membrane protein|nr:hypothetical protein [Bacillales bacterium]
MEMEFLTSLLMIIAIDIVLGGDNAIVIAMATRNLPTAHRNKAIFLGTGLAIFVRIILTILAVYLLKIPFLQLIGGILLVYISYQLLIDNNDSQKIESQSNLISAIKTIVFADIVMGVDNVLAIAGAAGENISLVVIGLLISVPIIIWGSKIILHFMEKYPVIVYFGSGILSLTAGKMIIHEKKLHNLIEANQYLNYLIPFIIITGVLLAGYISNKRIKGSSINTAA